MSERPVLAHLPENVAEFRGVQESLRVWWRDFDRAIEYVEPVDAHGSVYSHRFFELLLRAAAGAQVA